MKCSRCGREISKNQKFCKYCGEPVKEKTSGDNKRKKSNGLKIFLIIILILLIITAVGFSVYFFVLKKDDHIDRDNTIYTSEIDKDETDKDIENDTESSEDSKDNDISEQKEDIIIAESITEPINMEGVSVSCSSSLPEPQFNVYHTAENLIDGNIGTAWVEGVDGNGIGQYITFLFKNKGMISNISIYNGYQKTDDIYSKNSRAKAITINFGDGSSNKFLLEDMQGEQILNLDQPVETDSLTLVIESVYPGYKYEDTAISEINFY